MQNEKLRNMIIVSVLSAVALVIYTFLPEIPLVPGIDYLKLDFSDIPAVVAALTVGASGAFAVEIIKNIIHLFKTTTFGIGELMNIGICSVMAISLCLSTKMFSRLMKKDRMNAAVYYISGTVTLIVTVLAGWAFNALLTPVYFMIMGIDFNAKLVAAGVWGSTLLNAVKAAFNIFIFYPLYLSVYKFYKKRS